MKNWWIIDIGSFHEHKPSELNIDAPEDTMVLQISYENLIFLYTEAPRFHRIFRVLIENSYVALQKRLLQNISSTAEERYQLIPHRYCKLQVRQFSHIPLAKKRISSILKFPSRF